jgi:hypothetical protein
MTRFKEEARCAGSERKGGGIKRKRLEEEERVGKSVLKRRRKIMKDRNRCRLVTVPKVRGTAGPEVSRLWPDPVPRYRTIIPSLEKPKHQCHKINEPTQDSAPFSAATKRQLANSHDACGTVSTQLLQ